MCDWFHTLFFFFFFCSADIHRHLYISLLCILFVVIMTENKKYYYFTFIREKDELNKYNTFVTDEHPIEFVIKQKGGVMILYSIEITKEQHDNFVYATRNR